MSTAEKSVGVYFREDVVQEDANGTPPPLPSYIVHVQNTSVYSATMII